MREESGKKAGKEGERGRWRGRKGELQNSTWYVEHYS